MTDLRTLTDEGLTRRLAELDRSQSPKDDARALLHDLEVHQVELEMQNRELREAQQALEQTRDRYTELYDQAPVGYLTLDSSGLIVQINLTGARLLSTERTRVEGRSLARWVDPVDQGRLRVHVRETLATTEVTRVDLRLQPGPGRVAEIRLESQRQAELDGTRPCCHSAMIDISERRRAERQWQDTFDASPDPIFIHDEAFRIVRANQAYGTLVGLAPEAILGHRYFELFPKGAAPTPGCALGMAQEVGPVEELTTPDGRYFRQRSYPLKDHGQERHSVHVLQELTGLRQTEAALRRQAGELVQRNEELERFNQLMVGREMVMIELKQRVNELSRELGRAPPFSLGFLDTLEPGRGDGSL